MKLNGNLVLNNQGNSEIRNLIIERLPKASEPAVSASEKGRIYFDTTNNVYLFNNGTEWLPFATGGNAAAIQTEVDAIEASLGAFVGTDGTFNEAALNALDNVTGLTGGSSLLDALSQIDAAITAAAGVDTLGELSDVTLTTPSVGQVLRFTGSGNNSVNATLVLDDLGDVDTSLPSAGDVLYHNGTQFVNAAPGATSGVQAHDDTLDDLSALGEVANDQIIVGTGPGTFAYESGATARTSLGAQTQGDVLDDLNDLGAATADGQIIVADGAGSFTYESDATARQSLGLTIGTDVQAFDEVLQDLSNLPEVADNQFIVGDGVGSFSYEGPATVRTTLGLVSGGAGDIWVEKAGDAMTGNLNMGSNLITSLGEPVQADDAATKNYVDSIASGLDLKQSVRLATTAALPAYTAAGSGAGKTLTADVNGALIIDGFTVAPGDRILVKNEGVADVDHGIYTVTQTGDGSSPFLLTRSQDADGNPGNEVSSGMFTFVEEGTVNEDQGFALVTNDPIAVDTTALEFTQFTGAGFITAGVGLGQQGNVINVNLGAGIAELPSDEVGIELYDFASGALTLTTDGVNRTTGTDARLHLKLDSTSLAQSAAGLRVANGGIGVAQLNSAVAGDGIEGGNGSPLQLDLKASSGLVIDSGELSLDTIPNSALANSGVTLVADNGTNDPVSLGENLGILGTTGISTTTNGSNSVEISIDASINDLNDVTLTAPAADNVLQWNGSAFVNVSPSTVVGDADLDDLANVNGVASSNSGDVLMWNGTTSEVVARPTYFLYSSSAPSTSHTVSHALGRQYCNVTVVDSTDEVIIPQSIVFDSANQLTVAFNTAIDCKVVVMAVPAL